MKAPTDLAQISIRPSLHMMSRHFLCLTTGAETFKLRESGGRSISAAPGVPPYVSGRTDRGAVPPLDGPPQSQQRPVNLAFLWHRPTQIKTLITVVIWERTYQVEKP